VVDGVEDVDGPGPADGDDRRPDFAEALFFCSPCTENRIPHYNHKTLPSIGREFSKGLHDPLVNFVPTWLFESHDDQAEMIVISEGRKTFVRGNKNPLLILSFFPKDSSFMPWFSVWRISATSHPSSESLWVVIFGMFSSTRILMPILHLYQM
jgi:hypothetical protein